MFVAFPIPSSMFQRCAILLVLAQQKETKLLHASHSKWHETFQLPWVSNGVTKANTEKKQFPFNRPQYKGNTQARSSKWFYWESPTPLGPAIFHLSLPNPAPPMSPPSCCLPFPGTSLLLRWLRWLCLSNQQLTHHTLSTVLAPTPADPLCLHPQSLSFNSNEASP